MNNLNFYSFNLKVIGTKNQALKGSPAFFAEIKQKI